MIFIYKTKDSEVGGGHGPAKGLCHVLLYFWSTSGYLKVLESRSKLFWDANNINIHTFLSHMAKCPFLRCIPYMMASLIFVVVNIYVVFHFWWFSLLLLIFVNVIQYKLAFITVLTDIYIWGSVWMSYRKSIVWRQKS